jgi:hypothetical protein
LASISKPTAISSEVAAGQSNIGGGTIEIVQQKLNSEAFQVTPTTFYNNPAGMIEEASDEEESKRV